MIEGDGPLPPERVAEIGLKVLDALCAAHAPGVLHRDVKPHNVLIADDGRVVLTDFGLATFDGDSAVTRAGHGHGLAAVRRAGAGHATARRRAEADLWSLGATLYAAVEGRSPFARRDHAGHADRAGHQPARPGQAGRAAAARCSPACCARTPDSG